MVSNALKQPSMDCLLPSTSALPWVWVLEILARSKQVDVSLLLDLVKKVPETSDGIFSNVRELVFLRILETIYAQEACESFVSSDSSQKFGFDPSEHCEDVLELIIHETSASNLKAAGAEMSKWDIQPFLEHKRSSFPKCFLEKVKDAILTGNHPPLVSLIERSGLPVGNQPEPKAPEDGGDCNGITTSPNRNDSGTQMCSEKDKLISPVPENSKYPLHENLPAKSKISAPPEIVEGSHCKDLIMWEDNLEAIMKSVEKYKSDTISSEKQIPHGTTEAPLDRSNEESSQDYVAAKANVERGGDFKNKDEGLGQDCNVDDAECDDQGLQDHNRTANVNMGELDQNIRSNVPNADEAKKRESCIDNDQHNEEMADIATKKEVFLSSQCTFSQDSLADDWSELNLCVKCRKGENVLVCCSNSCPLVIHESCLVIDANFDKDGKFYCPFCAYSRAVSEYQEAKKKASTARNDLTTFIFTESRKETEKQSGENHSKQVDGLTKSYDLKNRDSTEAICKGKLDCERAGPSKFSTGDGPLCRVKEVGSTDRPPHTKSKHEQERKRSREVSHSPRNVRQRQTDEKALHEVSERNDEQVKIRSKKGVSCPTETDLPCERESSPSAESADEEEISEEDSENLGAPKYDVNVKKPEKQCLLRVQKKGRLFWTSEEETKLKEAMEVICDEEYMTIPWKKILEYGAGTFHEDRTAGQLKDKWRNICKAANKQ